MRLRWWWWWWRWWQSQSKCISVCAGGCVCVGVRMGGWVGRWVGGWVGGSVRMHAGESAYVLQRLNWQRHKTSQHLSLSSPQHHWSSHTQHRAPQQRQSLHGHALGLGFSCNPIAAPRPPSRLEQEPLRTVSTEQASLSDTCALNAALCRHARFSASVLPRYTTHSPTLPEPCTRSRATTARVHVGDPARGVACSCCMDGPCSSLDKAAQ